MPRWFLHVDLDEFLAAVEVLRRPELRGRPVVVGGDGDPTQPRTVVATASYAARAFGVRSGMPLRTALRKCPDAVFLPSDRAAYDAASERVMETLRRFDVIVEVWGWDEAALGADTDDPEALAGDVQRGVLDATGLSCSIGIGDNKLRAKMATAFAKPAGVFRLTESNWMELFGDRETHALWGIGPKTARKLTEAGIDTVRDLAGADVTAMAERFGPTTGPWYVMLGRGIGSTQVDPKPRERRGLSHQKTFRRDLVERGAIVAAIRELAEAVTDDVMAEGRTIQRVALTVRTATFFTRTRITKLPEPTVDVDAVAGAAVGLLDRFDLARPVRMLAVRAELTAREEHQ